MRLIQELTLDHRMYPGVQDPPNQHFRIPFIGDVDMYRYYIIEANDVKYLADGTLYKQCLAGDQELVGTIPLFENEVIVEDGGEIIDAET